MKKGISILAVGALVAFCILPVGVDDASAVPGFARQNQMNCSNCHTTWSQLTEYGRQFKESGYTGSGTTQDISDRLSWYESLPFSGRLNMRLVDVSTSKNKTEDEGEVTDKEKQLKMRAMHEFELFFAGMLSENFSFYAEIEGEDEILGPSDDDGRGFALWFAHGSVGYHPVPEFNVNLGWGTPYFADPYNTLNARKTNRYGRVVDGFLPGTAQFVSFSGRYQNLFYMAAVHDHPSNGDLDLEGHDPYDLSFRAAYDVMAEEEGRPHVSIGVFFTRKTETFYLDVAAIDTTKIPPDTTITPGPRRDARGGLNTFGGDLQVDYQGAHLNVIFAAREDSVDTTGDIYGDIENTDWCLTAELHYFMMQDDAPVFGPSIIFEKYTKHTRKTDPNTMKTSFETDNWTKLGIFATYFARENVKAQVGWEGTISAPDEYKKKDSRITVVLDLGF